MLLHALLAITLWTLALNHASSGAHMMAHGLGWLTTSRDLDERPSATLIEERLARAHRNHLENVVVFLPLCLLALHLGHGDSDYAAAFAWLFLASRIGHAIFYTLGVPALRSLSHGLGLLTHAGMGLVALGWLASA